MPGQPWGIRSIPEIDSRYPIWDQPNLVRDIDEGRFYLPDAEAGRRETLVTSVIDARPTHCQRLPGNSFLPLVAAVTLGGFFVLGTFHIWWAAIASAALALAIIVYWLWIGTAVRPEKPRADVGLGLELPLYATGSGSLGWWGMCITMLADVTAYACIVFGYFFFWTIHDDFPPDPASGPGVLWPVVGGSLVVGAWLLTVLARRWNRQDRSRAFYLGLASAMVLAALGAVALIVGPWRSGLDPTAHAYPATVWLIVLWTALHVAVGTILQLYCVARRLAGRMTAEHDIDAHVVTLYWHFTALTAAITTLVIAMFPLIT